MKNNKECDHLWQFVRSYKLEGDYYEINYVHVFACLKLNCDKIKEIVDMYDTISEKRVLYKRLIPSL